MDVPGFEALEAGVLICDESALAGAVNAVCQAKDQVGVEVPLLGELLPSVVVEAELELFSRRCEHGIVGSLHAAFIAAHFRLHSKDGVVTRVVAVNGVDLRQDLLLHTLVVLWAEVLDSL